MSASAVAAQWIARMFASESFGEVVGLDATVLLEAANDGERHHRVVCDGPGRGRRFTFGETLVDDVFAGEKAFAESVANGETVEGEERAFHARGVIWRRLCLRAHVR